MKPVIIFSAILFSSTIAAQHSKESVAFYFHGGHRSSLFMKEAKRQTLHSETESEHHKCIVLNTGIRFYIRSGWRMSASFTYDHFGAKHRSVEFSNLSYLLRCDRIWKEENRYTIYSGLMAGMTKTREFDKEVEIRRRVSPGYHVYLAGAEYKLINHLSVDGNIGWGVAGIINMGATFNF